MKKRHRMKHAKKAFGSVWSRLSRTEKRSIQINGKTLTIDRYVILKPALNFIELKVNVL